MSSYLYTSASISEGHPDKLGDQLLERVLDATLQQDPTAGIARNFFWCFLVPPYTNNNFLSLIYSIIPISILNRHFP